jgi:hypothetical protein
VRWVLVDLEKGDDIPDDALETGLEECGVVLHSIRAWWDGGVHIGKAWETRNLTPSDALALDHGSERPPSKYSFVGE